MTIPVLRRAGAMAASAVLFASVATIAAPAANAASVSTPLSRGATWVAAQVNSTTHLVHDDQYNFDDIGGTIYATYALQAAGGHTALAKAMTNAVGGRLVGSSGYIEADEYDYSPPYAFKQHGYYANAAANALVFAEAQGKSVTNWNHVNLVAKVEARIATTTGATGGKIADDSFYGDYANSIGQALAARGLAAAHSTDAAAALTFLLKQQCSAGYFRLSFDAGSDNSWTCDSGIAGGKSPADTDVTSMVMRQLEPLAKTNGAAAIALGKAKTWLLGQQHADGSFGGGPSTPSANANSTGLAGWALGDLGQTKAATAAAVWLRQHQAQELSACPSKLSSQTGAIAYNDAALADGRAQGIPTTAKGQWRLATFQALPALRWAPTTGGTVAIQAPTSFLRAGTRVAVSGTGFVPGSQTCFALGTKKIPVAAGLTGRAVATFSLPAGTAKRVVSVTDGVVSKTATLKVLGAVRFGVAVSNARPHAGTTIRVTVRRLAANEPLTVRVNGKVIRRARAAANGTFAFNLRVTRPLGKKTIAVSGAFPAIRSGSTSITVIR